MRKIRENNDDLNEEKNSKTNSQSKEQKKKNIYFSITIFFKFFSFSNAIQKNYLNKNRGKLLNR